MSPQIQNSISLHNTNKNEYKKPPTKDWDSDHFDAIDHTNMEQTVITTNYSPHATLFLKFYSKLPMIQWSQAFHMFYNTCDFTKLLRLKCSLPLILASIDL